MNCKRVIRIKITHNLKKKKFFYHSQLNTGSMQFKKCFQREIRLILQFTYIRSSIFELFGYYFLITLCIFIIVWRQKKKNNSIVQRLLFLFLFPYTHINRDLNILITSYLFIRFFFFGFNYNHQLWFSS